MAQVGACRAPLFKMILLSCLTFRHVSSSLTVTSRPSFPDRDRDSDFLNLVHDDSSSVAFDGPQKREVRGLREERPGVWLPGRHPGHHRLRTQDQGRPGEEVDLRGWRHDANRPPGLAPHHFSMFFFVFSSLFCSCFCVFFFVFFRVFVCVLFVCFFLSFFCFVFFWCEVILLLFFGIFLSSLGEKVGGGEGREEEGVSNPSPNKFPVWEIGNPPHLPNPNQFEVWGKGKWEEWRSYYLPKPQTSSRFGVGGVGGKEGVGLLPPQTQPPPFPVPPHLPSSSPPSPSKRVSAAAWPLHTGSRKSE